MKRAKNRPHPWGVTIPHHQDRITGWEGHHKALWGTWLCPLWGISVILVFMPLFVSFIYLYLFNKQTNEWIKWWGLNPEPCAYGANWTTSPVSTFLLLPEAEGKMITFVFSSHSTSSHKLRSALWLWRLWGSGKGPSSHERDRVTHWRSGRVPTGWVLVQPSCEAWKATQCCG